jgi:hypothetical protein
MPKLIAFSEPGYSGTSQEFRSNDPDLTLNGDDFIIKSAIVLSGSWTLYDDVLSAGTSIALGEAGGPDADGSFKDHADWGGAVPFHVKSINHG